MKTSVQPCYSAVKRGGYTASSNIYLMVSDGHVRHCSFGYETESRESVNIILDLHLRWRGCIFHVKIPNPQNFCFLNQKWDVINHLLANSWCESTRKIFLVNVSRTTGWRPIYIITCYRGLTRGRCQWRFLYYFLTSLFEFHDFDCFHLIVMFPSIYRFPNRLFPNRYSMCLSAKSPTDVKTRHIFS